MLRRKCMFYTYNWDIFYSDGKRWPYAQKCHHNRIFLGQLRHKSKASGKLSSNFCRVFQFRRLLSAANFIFYDPRPVLWYTLLRIWAHWLMTLWEHWGIFRDSEAVYGAGGLDTTVQNWCGSARLCDETGWYILLPGRVNKTRTPISYGYKRVGPCTCDSADDDVIMYYVPMQLCVIAGSDRPQATAGNGNSWWNVCVATILVSGQSMI